MGWHTLVPTQECGECAVKYTCASVHRLNIWTDMYCPSQAGAGVGEGGMGTVWGKRCWNWHNSASCPQGAEMSQQCTVTLGCVAYFPPLLLCHRSGRNWIGQIRASDVSTILSFRGLSLNLLIRCWKCHVTMQLWVNRMFLLETLTSLLPCAFFPVRILSERGSLRRFNKEILLFDSVTQTEKKAIYKSPKGKWANDWTRPGRAVGTVSAI